MKLGPGFAFRSRNIGSVGDNRDKRAFPQPLMKLFNIVLHVKTWFQLKVWMWGRWTPHLRSLYWYDIPLPEALSWSGLFRVIRWNLFPHQTDPIAANYGIVNLYHAKPNGDGRGGPAPTVWHCRALTQQPWWDHSSPIVEALESKAEVITKEFLALRESLPCHPDDNTLTARGHWRGAFLYTARGENKRAVTQLCPETLKAVEGLPLCLRFGFTMFSQLAPGTEVEPHTGSSNLRLRHHLALVVPEGNNCTLKVAGESRCWQQGRVLAFDDTFLHSVSQQASQPRAVLVVDVWHPDLSEAERQTLSHPLFSAFGKGQTPDQFRARLAVQLRSLVLLRRHLVFWRAFFFPSGKEKVREVLTHLFRVCDQFLRELGLEYFLDCGTLLGYHREANILLGDVDIDLGLRAGSFETVWAGQHLLPEGFSLHDTSYRHHSPKLYIAFQGWEADLFFYEDVGDQVCWYSEREHPVYTTPVAREDIFPLRAVSFLGVSTWVPNQTEAYLKQRYNDLSADAKRDQATGYYYPSAE